MKKLFCILLLFIFMVPSNSESQLKQLNVSFASADKGETNKKLKTTVQIVSFVTLALGGAAYFSFSAKADKELKKYRQSAFTNKAVIYRDNFEAYNDYKAWSAGIALGGAAFLALSWDF